MRRVVLGILVTTALHASLAHAEDIVVLRSGARITGRVVSETDGRVVVELGTGRSRVTYERDAVASIERGPPTEPAPIAAVSRVRDEWYLLKSAERTAGTRHLVVAREESAQRRGWRLEEHLVFVAGARMPAVRVERIETVDAELRPLHLHYGERGEPGGGDRPYETFRAGPVVGGVWQATTRTATESTTTSVELPPSARGPLAMREALVRASPRPPGLVEMPLVDTSRGEVRTVRAGFTAIDAGGTATRVDVMRVEDGDRALESRWAPGDPPRCLVEDVAPGVVAVPCTREQADAAVPPPRAAPDPRSIATVRPGDPRPQAPPPPRDVMLPELGVAWKLPPGWTADVVPSQPEEVGVRVVARMSSRSDAADARVEWDPAGARGNAAAAQADLVARLRRVSRDVAIDLPRRDVDAAPGVWRMRLTGTVRGERLRTWVLVADRAGGRLTVLVACPESAVADVGRSIDAFLDSFRRL